MKRTIGAAIAAAVALGAGLVAPAAVAVPSSVVTSAEFYRVAYGNSVDFVRKTFGTNGTITQRVDEAGTADDYLSIEFPTYYDGGFVQVDFARRASGTWYLTDKYAFWGNTVTRTADKATAAEFDKISQGNTIAYVRSTFGTNGTITEYVDARGTQHDGVVVEWPTESPDGWLQVSFARSSTGLWKVDTRVAVWGEPVARPADKATETELDQVRTGNSLDHARRTFGSAGTVTSVFDAPGTSSDSMSVDWPTESELGSLTIDFGRGASGVWKVSSRWVYWGVSAAPSDDVATEEELAMLRGALAKGKPVALTEARSVLGSPGTVVYRGDEAGTEYDQLVVQWFTGTEGEDVAMSFSVVSGTWAARTTDDLWGPWSATALRSRSSAEPTSPALVPPARTAPVRPSWDLRDAG